MAVSENTSRGTITPPQGFCILMNIYRLFKFSTLDSVSQHVTLQKQCIFIIYDSAGRNGTKQVLKLIELKSNFTT